MNQTPWAEVEESEEFKALSDEQKYAAQEQYFNEVVSPNLTEDDVPVARNQFFTEFGRGPSTLSAMGTQAGKSFLEMLGPSTVGGAGALAKMVPGGEQAGEEFIKYADSMQRGIESGYPVSPEMAEKGVVQAAGAAGQAAGFLVPTLLTGGAGAGAAATRAVGLGLAGLAGARGSEQEAERFGIDDPVTRAVHVLGGAAREALTESILGVGGKSYSALAAGMKDILRGSVGKEVAKTIGGEAFEEGISGVISPLQTRLATHGPAGLSTDVTEANGQQLPNLPYTAEGVKDVGWQSLMGAVGGTVFAGPQYLMMKSNPKLNQAVPAYVEAKKKIDELIAKGEEVPADLQESFTQMESYVQANGAHDAVWYATKLRRLSDPSTSEEDRAAIAQSVSDYETKALGIKPEEVEQFRASILSNPDLDQDIRDAATVYDYVAEGDDPTGAAIDALQGTIEQLRGNPLVQAASPFAPSRIQAKEQAAESQQAQEAVASVAQDVAVAEETIGPETATALAEVQSENISSGLEVSNKLAEEAAAAAPATTSQAPSAEAPTTPAPSVPRRTADRAPFYLPKTGPALQKVKAEAVKILKKLYGAKARGVTEGTGPGQVTFTTSSEWAAENYKDPVARAKFENSTTEGFYRTGDGRIIVLTDRVHVYRDEVTKARAAGVSPQSFALARLLAHEGTHPLTAAVQSQRAAVRQMDPDQQKAWREANPDVAKLMDEYDGIVADFKGNWRKVVLAFEREPKLGGNIFQSMKAKFVEQIDRAKADIANAETAKQRIDAQHRLDDLRIEQDATLRSEASDKLEKLTPGQIEDLVDEFMSVMIEGDIDQIEKAFGRDKGLLGRIWGWIKKVFNVGMGRAVDAPVQLSEIGEFMRRAQDMGIAKVVEGGEGGERFSTAKAAELAPQYYEELKQLNKDDEESFFSTFWPMLLKKSGLNLKPSFQNLNRAAEIAVTDVADWLKNNPRYLDYYHTDWNLTKDILKEAFPDLTDDETTAFRLFTGLTSPNTSLPNNMADAVRVLDLWRKRGTLADFKLQFSPKGNRQMVSSPFVLSGTTGPVKAFALQVIEKLHSQLGSWDGVLNKLRETVNYKQLHEFNREMGFLGPVGDIGKVRAVVQEATGQQEQIPRMFILGPKVGAYTLNSTGDDRFTTTDVWEARFIRSHFPQMFQQGTGLPTYREEGELFQMFASKFNQKIRAALGQELSPSALQAARWFYMIQKSAQAGYRYAKTTGTISDYTRDAIERYIKPDASRSDTPDGGRRYSGAATESEERKVGGGRGASGTIAIAQLAEDKASTPRTAPQSEAEIEAYSGTLADPITLAKTRFTGSKLTEEQSRQNYAQLKAIGEPDEDTKVDFAQSRRSIPESVALMTEWLEKKGIEPIDVKDVFDIFPVRDAEPEDNDIFLNSRGDFSEIGSGSEGVIIESKSQPGVVYKVYVPFEREDGDDGWGVRPTLLAGPNGYTVVQTVGDIMTPLDKARVISGIGGVPQEFHGIDPDDGFIVTKMPLGYALKDEFDAADELMIQEYPDEANRPQLGDTLHRKAVKEISKRDKQNFNEAMVRHGLVKLTAKDGVVGHIQMGSDVYITALEGKPYILTDVRAANVLDDNYGMVRIVDAAVAELLPVEYERFPELTKAVEGAIAREKEMDSDRSNDRFSTPRASEDAAYLTAVERGDMETAQRMVGEAAKAAGYNVGPLWHGTKAKFSEFDLEKAGSNNDAGMWGTGFYFSPIKKMSRGYGDRLLSVYLSLKNPLVLRGNEDWPDIVNTPWKPTRTTHGEEGKRQADAMREMLISAGYDGVMQYERHFTQRMVMPGEKLSQVVAFSPSQIKSADPVTRDDQGNVIPLSQRFDAAKSDIRFSTPLAQAGSYDTLVDDQGRKAQRDRGFGEKNLRTRRGDGAGADPRGAPKEWRGKTIRLTHWSRYPSLKSADPSKHGTGGIGAEKSRKTNYPKLYVNRTYFGYGKYQREQFIGGERYTTELDGSSIYDYSKDPLDLYPDTDEVKASGNAMFDKQAAETIYERKIRDAGYSGYRSSGYSAVAMFDPAKLTKVENSDKSEPPVVEDKFSTPLANKPANVNLQADERQTAVDKGAGESNRAAAGELPDGRAVRGGRGVLEEPGGPLAAGEPLRGLEGKVANIDIPGRGTVTFGPFETARETARRYMERAGLPYNPPTTYQKVDRQRAERIASAYEAMPHDPTDPEVAASYDAMIRETMAQWEAIMETGLKVEPMPPGEDPYEATPRLAVLDVIENNHMWFFPTNQGFGSGDKISDNPLEATKTGVVLNGMELVANDMFRVVHDYFGHIKEGVGFRADGEENAWRSHSAMFSPLARKAMTTETRGQNSWLNYGPHGDKNRKAVTADTVFAPQKIGLLPEWVVEEGSGDRFSTPLPSASNRYDRMKWTDDHLAEFYKEANEKGFNEIVELAQVMGVRTQTKYLREGIAVMSDFVRRELSGITEAGDATFRMNPITGEQDELPPLDEEHVLEYVKLAKKILTNKTFAAKFKKKFQEHAEKVEAQVRRRKVSTAIDAETGEMETITEEWLENTDYAIHKGSAVVAVLQLELMNIAQRLALTLDVKGKKPGSPEYNREMKKMELTQMLMPAANDTIIGDYMTMRDAARAMNVRSLAVQGKGYWRALKTIDKARREAAVEAGKKQGLSEKEVNELLDNLSIDLGLNRNAALMENSPIFEKVQELMAAAAESAAAQAAAEQQEEDDWWTAAAKTFADDERAILDEFRVLMEEIGRDAKTVGETPEGFKASKPEPGSERTHAQIVSGLVKKRAKAMGLLKKLFTLQAKKEAWLAKETRKRILSEKRLALLQPDPQARKLIDEYVNRPTAKVRSRTPNPVKDALVKQVRDPVPEEDFVNELMKLNVPEDTARSLNLVAREKIEDKAARDEERKAGMLNKGETKRVKKELDKYYAEIERAEKAEAKLIEKLAEERKKARSAEQKKIEDELEREAKKEAKASADAKAKVERLAKLPTDIAESIIDEIDEKHTEWVPGDPKLRHIVHRLKRTALMDSRVDRGAVGHMDRLRFIEVYSEAFEKAGVEKLAAHTLATRLYEENVKLSANAEQKKRARTVKSKAFLEALIKDIYSTSISAKGEATYAEDQAAAAFRAVGLNEAQAKQAAQALGLAVRQAQQKAQMEALERAAKKMRMKNPTIETLKQAIRSGLANPADPVASALARLYGFKELSLADYKRLAEADEMTRGTSSEQAMGQAIMLKIIRKSDPPKKLLDMVLASWVPDAISGSSNYMLNLTSPMFSVFRNNVIRVVEIASDAARGKTNFNQTAARLGGLLTTFNRSMGELVDQLRFSAVHDAYKNRMAEHIRNIDTLIGQSEKAVEMLKDGIKSKNPTKVLGGAMRWIYSTVNLIRRSFSTIDQAWASTLTRQSLEYEVLRELYTKNKVTPQEASLMMLEADTLARDQLLQKQSARAKAGFEPMDTATSNAVRHDLFQEALISQMRNRYGMENAESMGFAGQKEGDMELGNRAGETAPSADVFNNIIEMFKDAAIAMRRDKSPGQKSGPFVTALSHMLTGFISVPANVLNRSFYFTPVGIARASYKLREYKNDEVTSHYNETMSTRRQAEFRMMEGIVGSILMAAYIALKATMDDDEEDEEGWGLNITGAGPKDPKIKEAWTKKGHHQNAVELSTPWGFVSIPWGRGGFEGVSMAAIPMAAVGDMQLNGIDPDKAANVGHYAGAMLNAFASQGKFFGIKSTTEGLFQSDQQAVSKVVYSASPFLPFSGLLKSLTKAFGEDSPMDKSSPTTAFWASTPVAGIAGSAKINAFGDQMEDLEWLNRAWFAGVPVSFSDSRSPSNDDLYSYILREGIAPSAPVRSTLERANGAMTDEKWFAYAEARGKTMKTAVRSALPKLSKMDRVDAENAMERISADATSATKKRMGLK